MKTILIAGAGHGGLVAAAMLAKNGMDVTVYEKQGKETLGHDWEDRFSFDKAANLVGKEKYPENLLRARGDCAFVSPSHRKKVVIRYDEKTRQRMTWRKPLLQMLLSYAEECGVKIVDRTEVYGAIVEGDTVVGLKTEKGEERADLVIDAAGVFSPVRSNLPDAFGIEKTPKYGDVFYAYRAYFDKIEGREESDVPFEVFLYHEGKKGLSWHLIADDCVDILIGRIYPLTEEKIQEQLALFRKNHPCTGETILHGGQKGVIPVRRPLTKMVARGYAAVGDSAFMTTPMNGMGIDLSLQAGRLLASAILKAGNVSVETLWAYNRAYHETYYEIAKNEGLKNALLSMPKEGVDFLFESEVIQSSDLSGAGRNTKLSALLGKFARGMKKPKYFFTLLKGLIKGSRAAKMYSNPPKTFDEQKIAVWNTKIEKKDIRLG